MPLWRFPFFASNLKKLLFEVYFRYLYFCFIKKCFYLWNVYSMIMLNEIRILQNRSYKGLFECWLYWRILFFILNPKDNFSLCFFYLESEINFIILNLFRHAWKYIRYQALCDS